MSLLNRLFPRPQQPAPPAGPLRLNTPQPYLRDHPREYRANPYTDWQITPHYDGTGATPAQGLNGTLDTYGVANTFDDDVPVELYVFNGTAFPLYVMSSPAIGLGLIQSQYDGVIQPLSYDSVWHRSGALSLAIPSAYGVNFSAVRDPRAQSAIISNRNALNAVRVGKDKKAIQYGSNILTPDPTRTHAYDILDLWLGVPGVSGYPLVNNVGPGNQITSNLFNTLSVSNVTVAFNIAAITGTLSINVVGVQSTYPAFSYVNYPAHTYNTTGLQSFTEPISKQNACKLFLDVTGLGGTVTIDYMLVTFS